MSTQVTVIGLGPMGHAMAAAFLRDGYEVTVWNRTAAKADDLVAAGARRAATPGEALAASELVILSLTGYDAMYSILGPHTAALAGRDLVNLSSDTPERARAAAGWAAGHGARHLTGGVSASPQQIGQPGVSTYYSGPKEVFEAHEQALKVITATDYKGEDPGLAALFYQLSLDLFWTTTAGWLHALAVARANGVRAAELLPAVSDLLSGMPDFLGFYTPRIDAAEYPGDAERLSMAVASIEHVVQTARDAGVDATLPEAVMDLFHRGVTAGHAGDSATSVIEIM